MVKRLVEEGDIWKGVKLFLAFGVYAAAMGRWVGNVESKADTLSERVSRDEVVITKNNDVDEAMHRELSSRLSAVAARLESHEEHDK